MNNTDILQFLQLFSHRYDYIRKSENWTTCTNYLNDTLLLALWESTDEIIGVRFGPKTKYCLLDIDINSPHHPHNSNNLKEVLGALEEVGLTKPVTIQSSHSKGLHIYYCFKSEVPTYSLGYLLFSTLTKSKFKIKPGHLEIFPNTKKYIVTKNRKEFTKYNGHRLPLQEGSFLLDKDYIPYSNTIKSFISAITESSENHDTEFIEETMKAARRDKNQYRKLNNRKREIIELWKKDLDKIMRKGWVDYHQTNTILLEISKYIIVFTQTEEHEQLSKMTQIITELPGYKEYCRHQHEIKKRCEDWLTYSRRFYWQIGSTRTRASEASFKKHFEPIEKNKKQQEDAEYRLKETLITIKEIELVSVSSLFRSIIKQSKKLFSKAFSNRTLYKYKNLWKHLIKYSPEAESKKKEESKNITEENFKRLLQEK